MKKSILAIVLTVPTLMIGAYAAAQTTTTDHGSRMNSSSDNVAPDNTKSNKQDPSNREATADTQKNDATDLDLAKRIRQSVVADKGLSTYAHNVKIVATNGTVTLNGVVRSPEEKMQIEKKAASIAGDGRVVDELKVAPPK